MHEAAVGHDKDSTTLSHSTVGKEGSHVTVGESEARANTKRRVSIAFPNFCVTVTAKSTSTVPVGCPGSPAEAAAVDQAMDAEEPKAKSKASPGDSPEERFVRAAAAKAEPKAAEAKARVTVHPKTVADQQRIIQRIDETSPKDPRSRPSLVLCQEVHEARTVTRQGRGLCIITTWSCCRTTWGHSTPR